MHTTYQPVLNRSFVIGVGILVTLVGGGIALSGDVGSYVSISSFFIVFGGVLGATLIHFSIEEIQESFSAVKRVLFYKKIDAIERIQFLTRLSQEIKKEGPLYIESVVPYISDGFLKKGLEVTVDGQEPTVIRKILETEMRTASTQDEKGVSVLSTMGSYAPALGLIGTLLGLISMMRSLSDPATVGPAMAVALLTTFYGAILANLFFLPLAGKIKNHCEESLFIKNLTLEGILSIRAGENPIVLEQRLESFLPGLK